MNSLPNLASATLERPLDGPYLARLGVRRSPAFARPWRTSLRRPESFVRVWNDGEQFNFLTSRAFELDPIVVADYEAAGVSSHVPNPSRPAMCGDARPGEWQLCRDWFSFVSAWRGGFSNRWRDCILAPAPNVTFAEYLIAGTAAGTGNWSYMREIFSAERADRNPALWRSLSNRPRRRRLTGRKAFPWHGQP